MDVFQSAYIDLLSWIFGYEYGSAEFYIYLGATLGGAVFIGRVLLTMFQSKRGFLSVMLFLIPAFALSLAANVAVQEYALPHLDVDWAPAILPWVATALVALVFFVCLGPRCIDLGPFISIFVACVSLAAAVGVYCGTEVAIDIFDFGSDQVEKNDSRVLKMIE
ncbi:MAG: hypothetical protein AAGC73_06840 [Verrucomicrobiota bacterium]